LLILALAFGGCAAPRASAPAPTPTPAMVPEAAPARPQFYEFYSPL
jgi:hypothetical protein